MLTSPFKKPWLIPPSEHPRLMVRGSDLERIRKNIASSDPVCRLAVQVYEELCEMPILCQGANPEIATYNLGEYLALEARALRALLSGEREHAREAIDTAMMLLENSDFESCYMRARWSGHLIFVCAEVYDWCYGYLTEEERALIIAKSETMAEKYFEMGYPPAKQAAISGHGSEAQLLRDLLSLGIAVYDERPDIYDFCAGRIIDEYVPAYDFMFAGGFHHQGPTYGSYRYTCLLWGALLFYSMSGEKIFTPKLDELAESFIYLTRKDGQALRLGDDTYEYKAPNLRNGPFTVPMFFAAAYTGKAQYYRLFESGVDREYLLPSKRGLDYYDGGSFGEGLFSAVAFLLWNGLTPELPEEKLSPYRYFGYPNGITVWNDGERLVLMKMGELWGSNHDHLDTGCFQIYCGGALASDSGVYDSYGTAHRMNYTIRTSAHNCLTVFNRKRPLYEEWKEGFAYDGGTRRPCKGREPKNVECWRENYRMARVLSHSESEELCTLVGDMSEAYSHTCNRAIRSMEWEPRAGEYGVLTVTDEVEKKSEELISAVHIHCQNEPRRIEGGVVIENGDYALVCRVLEPANAVIELIGGEGRRFETDGVNYDPTTLEHTEAGWGRVTVTEGEECRCVRYRVRMEIVKR